HDKRGVFVLTDTDCPCYNILNTNKQYFPRVKHSFIPRDKAKNKRGKIGVEHASVEIVKEALTNVSSPLEADVETIDKAVLIDLGLIIGPEARRKREKLCSKLNIGHSNGKQLLNKLNAFGYTEKDVKEALGYKEE